MEVGKSSIFSVGEARRRSPISTMATMLQTCSDAYVDDMYTETDDHEDMSMQQCPCLVEKALYRLIAMGSGKPKTVRGLKNTLHSCTMVVPYLNPLMALKIANQPSGQHHPITTARIHRTKRRKYVRMSDHLDCCFVEDIENTALQSGRCFDLALRGGETEQSVMADALNWLGEEHDHEGTTEELIKELQCHCQKKVDRSTMDMVLRLEMMGYLEVQKERVIKYSLPQFDDALSQCIDLFRDHSSSDFTIFDMLDYCMETVSFDIFDAWVEGVQGRGKQRLRDAIDPVVYAKKDEIQRSWDSLVTETSEKVAMLCGGDVGVLDCLRTLLLLHSLHRIPRDERPNSLKDLRALMKPESLLYSVLPSRIPSCDNLGKIQHRQTTRKPRLGTRVRTEFLIGVAPGGNTIQPGLLPLTPEGLLGIVDDCEYVVSDPEVDQTGRLEEGTVTSPPIYITGAINNEKRAYGLSQAFGTALVKRLANQTQRSGAVLVQASEHDTQEIIGRVMNWINSYRHSEDETSRVLKSVRVLQNQLIELCVLKARRISPSTVVRSLQEHGYVTVNSGTTPGPEVTYHFAADGTLCGTGRIVNAPWQNQADLFLQTIIACHSTFLEKAFPPNEDIQLPKYQTWHVRKRSPLRNENRCSQQGKRQKTT